MGGADIGFLPEDIRFDDEEGKVVLTDLGNDKLSDMTGYYLKSQRQVNVWNLATRIKEDYEILHRIVKECNVIWGAGKVLDFKNDGTATINKDIVINL